MRQNIVDVGAPAGSFYRPCATRSRSRRSSPRCPHVETSSSRWWRCHQLAVLGRSNRRVRPSDRLFWVCVRRWWPRWKDRLVLVHPATVARRHREGFRWLGHRTAAAGTTTHRTPASTPHSAYGAGKRSLGRPANPRRVAEARIQCFRTHGVAVSARPTDATVPNLADIFREPRRQPGVHVDGAVPPCSAVMRAVRVHSVGRG